MIPVNSVVLGIPEYEALKEKEAQLNKILQAIDDKSTVVSISWHDFYRGYTKKFNVLNADETIEAINKAWQEKYDNKEKQEEARQYWFKKSQLVNNG